MIKVLAVPVSVGSVTIHVAKGRRWSVVEHLLLDAVCQKSRPAGELATLARLPVRMVVEAMINLMRAGWLNSSLKGGQRLLGHGGWAGERRTR